jgi:hypothetical protein
MLTLQSWMDKMRPSLQRNMNETLSDMNFLEKEIETSVSEVLTTLLDAWNSIGAATHKTICKHGGRWTQPGYKRKIKNHIEHG